MQEAWAFAENVSVTVDGEEMAYAEYINNLWGHDPTDGIHVVGKNHPDVKALHEKLGQSRSTISERLSYLLLPDEAQEWIDEEDLTKRAARMIVRKCRSGIDDPEDALAMMAAYAERYGPGRDSMSDGAVGQPRMLMVYGVIGHNR
ncbi:hypothetical protein [Halomarina pelagica]|uniref:hypothetical protein n=1 Tax=Halomarina pelagica TaxID=2961599 RepID=UPI0020C4DDA3|nr:hypothetical protein [Halomarina sp. BND7]